MKLNRHFYKILGHRLVDLQMVLLVPEVQAVRMDMAADTNPRPRPSRQHLAADMDNHQRRNRPTAKVHRQAHSKADVSQFRENAIAKSILINFAGCTCGQGPVGPPGPPGTDGGNGKDGDNGKDGTSGKDGQSVGGGGGAGGATGQAGATAGGEGAGAAAGGGAGGAAGGGGAGGAGGYGAPPAPPTYGSPPPKPAPSYEKESKEPAEECPSMTVYILFFSVLIVYLI